MIPSLQDIRDSLSARAQIPAGMPCHVGAFSAWVTGNSELLRSYVHQAFEFDGQGRHPEHVAALGYGAAAGLLDASELAVLNDEASHLAGRDFFAPGRPLRLEADGIALLGVSLGVSAMDTQGPWLDNLLSRAADIAGDPWQQGLARAARMAIGTIDLRIASADLAVALATKGVGSVSDEDLKIAWGLTTRFEAHNEGLVRDAVRLVVFDHVIAKQSQAAIKPASADDLTAIIRGICHSLKLWQYEEKGRTKRSAPGRWEIENEYHVQALLWTILAPVFSDLEDEENLPSIGHKHPRADLGIPSLRTIIEVKFLREVGQRALADVTEQVAADASLYLSRYSIYDTIVAVVWDDCAQTEQHHELQSGLQSIRGVSSAVIISRPAKMKRR